MSSKPGAVFTLTVPQFSWKIVRMYLAFVKFAVGIVDEYSQVAPHILPSFPVTESSICFLDFN